MILTTKLGRFEFDDDVLLSHAKNVRDTILGQWYNPKPGAKLLRTLEDCDAFIREHSSQMIAGVQFTLEFPDEHVLEEHVVLEELPQPPMIPVPPIWIRQALVGEQRPDWMDK